MARPYRSRADLALPRGVHRAPSSSTAAVFYGQMDRNWGPIGIDGIGVSDYGVFRDGARASIWGPRPCASTRWRAAFPTRRDSYRGPGPSLLLRPPPRRPPVRPASARGVGDDRARGRRSRIRRPLPQPGHACCCSATSTAWAPTATCMFGFDAPVAGRRARAARGTGRHRRPAVRGHAGRGQLAQSLGPSRGRLAGHSARGSPGARSTPRRRVSPSGRSIPFENFTDGDVGLGRNFVDQDQVTVTVICPGRHPLAPHPRAHPAPTGRGQDHGSHSRAGRRRPDALHRDGREDLARRAGSQRQAGTARGAGQRGFPPRGECGQRGRATQWIVSRGGCRPRWA